MKRKASITVTMTLVLFMVISLMLVTLEHAYVTSGRTLAFQAYNRSLESVLGSYYAPLYAEYGLLATTMWQGMYYKDYAAMEEDITKHFNDFFGKGTSGSEFRLWDYRIDKTSVTENLSLADSKGAIFRQQIKEAVKYQAVLKLSEEIMKLSQSGNFDIRKLIEGLENEDIGTEDESDDPHTAGFRSVWKTIKKLFSQGFPGFWFGDTADISTKRVNQDDLPSRRDYGLELFEDDELFGEISLTDAMINSGEYVDSFMKDGLFEKFLSAVNSGLDAASDKAALIAYANLNMDNFHKNDYKAGALNYEQEYLVFGSYSDNINLRKAGWSLFGIRFGMAIAYILSSSAAKAQIENFLAPFNISPKLKLALKALVSVAWAAENAIVETRALLLGKSVDFVCTAGNMPVRLSEILTFTADTCESKAKNYKPGSMVRLSYPMYLSIFMLLTDTEKLSFRMMDIIEANIKQNYDKDFTMRKTVVGFSCDATLTLTPRFFGWGTAAKKSIYTSQIQSAVYVR